MMMKMMMSMSGQGTGSRPDCSHVHTDVSAEYQCISSAWTNRICLVIAFLSFRLLRRRPAPPTSWKSSLQFAQLDR